MESLGLTQIVDMPTRANRTLDVLYTNRPDLFSVTVARSLVKSDHLAFLLIVAKMIALIKLTVQHLKRNVNVTTEITLL